MKRNKGKKKGSKFSKLTLFQKPGVKLFKSCPLSGKNAPIIDKKSPMLPNSKSFLEMNQTPKMHKAADKNISFDRGFFKYIK